MAHALRIETERLVLRSWTPYDAGPLAAMHADPEVMHDYPAPLGRAESDVKLARYQGAIENLGFGRLALERRDGAFLGYVGIMPVPTQHAAVGTGVEIGWRLARAAWGLGFATEAARAALEHGFREHGFAEVLSYTAPSNLKSRAVMERLGMSRQADRDFSYEIDGARYDAVVFVGRPGG